MRDYLNKKFNLKEIKIFYLCDGHFSTDEIAKRIDLTEEEILDIIDQYHKKGWLSVEDHPF